MRVIVWLQYPRFRGARAGFAATASSVVLSCLMVQPVLAQTDPAQLQALGQMQDFQDQRHLAAQQAITAAQQAQQQAAMNEARQQALRAQKQKQAREASQHLARQATQQQAEIFAEAQARAAAAEEQYLAEKRELELQKQRLQLKLEEAKANRADDFARANLERYQAETRAMMAKSAMTSGHDVSGNISPDDHSDTKKENASSVKTHHWWQVWK